jgi:parallel beta-helix repeat protein
MSFLQNRAFSLLVMASALSILLFVAQGEVINVGQDAKFSKIQDAIDFASSGDIIQVKAGIYFENLIVAKNITLKGEDNPLIDAQDNGSAISVLADGVTITGFNVTNSSDSDIEVRGNDNLIFNNTANGGHSGIVLDACTNNTVSGNIVRNNQESGIGLERSMKNAIWGNIAEGNYDTGIELEDSNDNYIKRNIVVNNSNDGIELKRSINNNIEYNFARENKDGICLEEGSNNNTISNNNVSYNHIDGILIRSSLGNVIVRNDISKNSKALFLEASSENILAENNVTNNMDGVFINYYSCDNQIYRNYLVGSLNYDAYDESRANQWDNGALGNHYSNFDKHEKGCTDANRNGICDAPYTIPGGSSLDRYPMASSLLQVHNASIYKK